MNKKKLIIQQTFHLVPEGECLQQHVHKFGHCMTLNRIMNQEKHDLGFTNKANHEQAAEQAVVSIYRHVRTDPGPGVQGSRV